MYLILLSDFKYILAKFSRHSSSLCKKKQVYCEKFYKTNKMIRKIQSPKK